MLRNILKVRIVDVWGVRIPAPRLRGGRLRAHDRCCSARMTGNGRGSIQVLKVCVVLALVVWASSSFADRPRYMKYDPTVPGGPYVYSDYDYSGVTKDLIQGELFLMTDEPEEFVRVFDFFKLDIDWRSNDERNHSYLPLATSLKDWAMVKPLIDRKINIDWQDSIGATALMYAALCGHLPTVGRLLVAGADPSIVSEGSTAIDAANEGLQDESYCPEGDYERVKELLTDALGDSKAGNDVADSETGDRIVDPPQESPAEVVEVEIKGFKFSCKTPTGKTIKPKFGDIPEGARFELPEDREFCLRTVDARINDACNHAQLETFRGATFFMSPEDAKKYAGCLPIFRKQAKECVAYFRWQRTRCE